MSERTKLGFCWLVGAGWLANLVAGMWPGSTYEPDLIAHAPMMLVLGAVFGFAKKRGGDSE